MTVNTVEINTRIGPFEFGYASYEAFGDILDAEITAAGIEAGHLLA